MNLLFVHRERISETNGKSKWKELCQLVTCTLAGVCAHKVVECTVTLRTKD